MKNKRFELIAIAGAAALAMAALSCRKAKEPPPKPAPAKPAATAPAKVPAKPPVKPPATAPATAAVKVPPGMVVLKTVLPRPRFKDTPPNIRADHFPPGGPRPDKPLHVPVGLKNLAKGRKVEASDDEPVMGELEYITDGNKEAQDDSFVELGPGKQHVQIDLGGLCEIFAIIVWHDHRTARVYRDVVVQVSDDEHFIEKKTIFNNDHDNSSGLGLGKNYEWIETYHGKIMPAGGVKGRYVRLYSDGSTASDENTYTEVEVYGRAATAGKSS